MKIIKHGSKYSENKIAICPLCGCEFECLKQTMCEIDLKIDYQTGEFIFFNLKVCETISIEKIEEIEVF